MGIVSSIVGGVLGAGAAQGAAGALESGAQQAQQTAQTNQTAANAAQQTALSNVTSAEQPYQSVGTAGANSIQALLANGGFTAPTLAQAKATPGYQFALNSGTNAIDENAAANGTLMSGNTGTALEQYGQNLGQNAYQQTYQNALNAYQTNVGTAQGALNTGLTSTGQLANTNLGVAGNTANIDLTSAAAIEQQQNNYAQAKAGGIEQSSQAIQNSIAGALPGIGSALNSSSALGNELPGWATIGLGI